MNSIPTPRLKISPQYVLSLIDEKSACLSTEDSGIFIHAPIPFKLLKKIGSSEVNKDELLCNYELYGSFFEVLSTLEFLEKEGYIEEYSEGISLQYDKYWRQLGYDPYHLLSVLDKQSVRLQNLGNFDLSGFKELAEATSLQISEKGVLDIVFVADYLDVRLDSINTKNLKNNRPWLLIRPNGTHPLIGPLFDPHIEENACWQCFAHRMKLHEQENTLYQSISGNSDRLPRPRIEHPLAFQAAFQFAVHQIVEWIYHGTHPILSRRIQELDPQRGITRSHHVVKRPQCETCGTPLAQLYPPKPIHLNRNLPLVCKAGAYRTITPEETIRRYQHLVSPLVGVVPLLEPYSALRGSPIYNYGSGKNIALQSKSRFWLNFHCRTGNGGKGKTSIQAKAGALCESIERFCGIYPGQTYTVTGKYSELPNAIHPNKVFNYSDYQLNHRHDINADTTRFYNLIPVKFDVDKNLEWTPIYSLTHNSFKLFPTLGCYAQYPSEDEGNLYAYPDSNGCAAGNTIEEAILQGLLELIERDAAGIWWYNRISRPGVDLHAANNPYIHEVLKFYQQIDRRLVVLDLTNDIGIPVFASVSYSSSRERRDEILFAFGAHVDASIALERAVIEMNQLLPVVQGTENYNTQDPEFLNWLNHVKIDDQKWLLPSNGELINIHQRYPLPCPTDLFDAIEFCMNQTEKQGLETLVLDLTQPDIGLNVVRVMVPGLRHFWRRTAPGRLYDVPVSMGWLEHANCESQLNPYSIFI